MRSLYFFSGLSLLQSVTAVQWPQRANDSEPAPYTRPEGGDLMDDHYFVRLKPGCTLKEHWNHIGKDLSKEDDDFVDLPSMNGYGVNVDNTTLHSVIRRDPCVANVEHGTWVKSDFDTDNGFTKGSAAKLKAEQSSTSRVKRWIEEVMQDLYWPSRMITSRTKQPGLPAGRFRYTAKTVANPGQGVDIYVLDSGIHISHEAFQGRASHFNGASQTPYCPRGDKTMDDNIRGHGTKVASLAIGAEFSISQANAINVKIWCGKDAQESAGSSLLAKAISDVTTAHKQKQQVRPSGWKGSIINMSLQSGQSGLIEGAIEDAAHAGITVVVSANNAEKPSGGNTFPCAWPTTICVSSVNRNYQFSTDFANYGKRVQVLAPGEDVWVAVNYNDNGATIGSGTSLATPIVASVLSHFIGYETIILNAATAKKRMNDNILKNVCTGLPANTVNYLINTGINYWNKRGPYIGSDGGELKVRDVSLEASLAARETHDLAARNLHLVQRQANNSNDSASTTITTSYTYSFISETESATYEGVLPTFGLNNTNATATSSASTSLSSSSSTLTSTPSTTSAPSSTSSTSSAPATTSSADLNSSICKSCESDLGASNCAASDDACLVSQCQSDTNCQSCGIDCNTYATAK